MRIILTAAAAVFFGSLLLKRKVPAGAMIGAMLGVGLFNCLFGVAYMPAQTKFCTQMITGAFIGAKISRRDLAGFKEILLPMGILSACMLLFSVGTGYLLRAVMGFDLVTALFATAPAGVADMTLIAMDMGGDAPKVAMLQLVRLLATLAMTPQIARWLQQSLAKQPFDITEPSRDETVSAPKTYRDLVLTVSVAFFAACLGKAARVPAGALSFAMVGCAALNLTTNRAYIPLKLRQAMQFLAGALIGTQITATQVREMLRFFPAVILLALGFLAMNLLSTVIIVKCTSMDLLTAILATAAGGLTDMSLVADDIGANAPQVAAMQLLRVVGVISIYPIIISCMFRLH